MPTINDPPLVVTRAICSTCGSTLREGYLWCHSCGRQPTMFRVQASREITADDLNLNWSNSSANISWNPSTTTAGTGSFTPTTTTGPGIVTTGGTASFCQFCGKMLSSISSKCRDCDLGNQLDKQAMQNLLDYVYHKVNLPLDAVSRKEFDDLKTEVALVSRKLDLLLKVLSGDSTESTREEVL